MDLLDSVERWPSLAVLINEKERGHQTAPLHLVDHRILGNHPGLEPAFKVWAASSKLGYST